MEMSLEHSLVSSSYVRVWSGTLQTSNGLWLTHAQVHNNYNHQLCPTCKMWLRIYKNVTTSVHKLSLGTYILLAMYAYMRTTYILLAVCTIYYVGAYVCTYIIIVLPLPFCLNTLSTP